MWGPAGEDGIRPRIAQVALALPHMYDSMAAKAAGLRVGLALTAHVVGHPMSLDVIGDNLLVLRLAAGNGRLRRPGM